MPETAQLTVRLDLEGNLSSGITKAQGQLNGLAKSVGRVGKGVGQVGAGFARAGLLVGGAAVAGLTAAAKAGIDFEDAFAGVVKTVDSAELSKAGLSFDKLATDFRRLATEIPITAVEFARIGEAAGALGVDAKDIVTFTETVAKLGVTTDLTADQAADSLGRIGTILDFTGRDYVEFADSLVALGNAGASTESEIIEITKRFAAEGKAAGLATEEIAGLASATASLGFAPERGGTALARVFANMSTNIALANDKGKAFAKTTGRSIKELQRDLDRGKGLEIFQDFLKGLKGLSATDAARVLKAAGITNVSDRTIFRTMADQLPFVNEQLDIAKNATGALLEEATKKFATTASKIQIFKNNVIEAGISLSEGFLPAVGRALDKLSTAFRDPGNKADIKRLGEEIGAALDDIDWDKVVSGARDLTGVLKSSLSITLSILDALNKLPTEIKAAAAAFLVLNKASGGLIGAGVGNIAGGLAETAIRGAGSRIPGVGALFAQPVFVTNWPVGVGGGVGGAGKAGGLAALAGPIAAAVAVALTSKEVTDATNRGLGTNFTNPFAGGIGGNIVSGLNNLSEVIKNWKPPVAPKARILPTDRDLDGAAFRPNKAPPVPFFKPDLLKPAVVAANRTTTAIETMRGNIGKDLGNLYQSALDQKIVASAQARTALETKMATSAGLLEAGLKAQRAGAGVESATRMSVSSAASRITSAIRAARPQTFVSVHVNATTVSKSVTVVNRYGPSGGSSTRDSRYGSTPI